MLYLLLFLILVSVIAVNVQLKQLIMTNEELLAQFSALVDQLVKAFGEITAEIQAIGTVPQSIVDKLTAAKAVAQQLDDLNLDAPAPSP